MVRVPEDLDGRPTYMQGFGGDTSTAIIAAARQGGRTGYISAVGNDMFGCALRALWTQEGVDSRFVLTDDAAETGVCFIDPDPRERQFTYARAGSAAAAFAPSDLPVEALESAEVFHLSGITLGISETMQAAAFAAVERCNSTKTLVSLDINYRSKLWPRDPAAEIIEEMTGKAGIVFASDDEAEVLFGLKTPDDVADFFLAKGPEIVFAKSGERGVMLATANLRQHIPPAASTPVDSSGAGDSFAGAFLAWFVETADVQLAARKAAEVAAATVSGLGAVEAIPRRKD